MAALDRSTSGVRFPPPLIFVSAVIGGFILHWMWPSYIALEGGSITIRLLGGLFLLLALALSLSAVRRFERAGTNVNPRKATTALVEDGPYRFTRNPMYLGLAAAQAGIVLLANAWWPLLTLVLALIVVRFVVIAREEHYLEAKFGDAYMRYASRVRRWL